MQLRTLLIDNYDSYTYNLFQLLSQVNGVEPIVRKNDCIDLAGIKDLLQTGQVHNIVISPGPGSPDTPADIGVCLEVFQHLPHVPVLGVCLGHQALAVAAGGQVITAPEPVHGRLSKLQHTNHPLLSNIPSGPEQDFEVVRYHSLIVESLSVPSCLEPIAWTVGSHHAVVNTSATVAQPPPFISGPGQSQPDHTPPPSGNHVGSSLPAVQGAGADMAAEASKQPASDNTLIMALAHRSLPHYGVQFHPESICSRYGMQLLVNFHQLSCVHLKQDFSLPGDLLITAAAPGCAHSPQPWPGMQLIDPNLPLGLAWRRLQGAVPPKDPHSSQMLFEQLFNWQRHTFWLDSPEANGGPHGRAIRVALTPRGQGRKQWDRRGTLSPSVVLISAAVLCALAAVHVLRSVLLTERAALAQARMEAQDHMRQRTLSFDVCKGMTSQRLAVAYGVILGAELGRTIVLPSLLTAGQLTTPNPASGTLLAFHQVFDEQHFISSMSDLGLDVMSQATAAGLTPTKVILEAAGDPVEQLSHRHPNVAHIHVTCPLYAIAAHDLRPSSLRLAQQVLQALRPAQNLTTNIQEYTQHLQSYSLTNKFNYLELRMAKDWRQHCADLQHTQQQHAQGSDTASFCEGNLAHIDQILNSFQFDKDVPLLVRAAWEMAEPQMEQDVLAQLTAAGYQVLTTRQFPSFYTTDARLNVLIDYELALRADKFMGSTYGTFGAVVILHRRQAGLWAAQYNQGPGILEQRMPAQVLPWVFAYTSETPENDYMLRVAVQSAAQYQTLKPFCVWAGEVTSPMYSWLQQQGVTMVQHNSSWAESAWAMVAPAFSVNTARDVLFKHPKVILNDLSTLDIPIMPEFTQYTYLLLTSPYVLFLREVSLTALAPQLPAVITMAHLKKGDVTQRVSGALLLNLPQVRASHQELRMFALGNRHGAVFNGYGAGAAGAYAQFYDAYMQPVTGLKPLAVTPHSNYEPMAHLLHFNHVMVHGYLEYYRSSTCNAPGGGTAACQAGWAGSLCGYMWQWQSHMNKAESLLGSATWYACETVYAPQMSWEKFQGSLHHD